MDPTSDPQSVAYREATDTDRWDGDLPALVADGGAVYHEPLTRIPAEVRLPGDYEAEDGWDTERENPKTLEQARAALAARIADPTAPDTDAHSGAYDDGDVAGGGS
ncbi:MAG: hypothetical protein ACRDTZ_18680 [Pseudonocardiaceae bacterium]